MNTTHQFRVVTLGNVLFKVQFLWTRTEKHMLKKDEELQTWHDVVFYNGGPPLFSRKEDALKFIYYCQTSNSQGEWIQVGEIV